VVSGRAGQERLLAIVTDEPLELDWMPDDPETPARVLTPADIEMLLGRLRALNPTRWSVLSASFSIVD
jgi:hypothetical protein